jgi:hypothetical protein
MTEENLSDQVREIIGKMHDHANHDNVRGTEEEYIRFFAGQLNELLPPPPRPTMADMNEEERAACQWMQCDAGPAGRRGLIVKVSYWSVYVADKETGVYSSYTPDLVTALPDLPRMEWNGTEKVEEATPAEVGDVIESADDPRLDALPVGTVLVDCDGETVAKRSEAWAGLGYIPIESEGDEFGPWTVRRIGWEDDQ